MVAASDSCGGDALIIANAFRAATDEDTRLVLNAMAAKKTPSSLVDLTFYMVPSSWMVKAWPLLSAKPTMMPSNNSSNDHYGKLREEVGAIPNNELLSCDHAVSSSDDEDGNGRKSNNFVGPKQASQQSESSSSSSSLRTGLKHGVDFLLLGPSAWFLVKEKFGFDKELGRPCIFHNTGQSTISVAIVVSQQGGNKHPGVQNKNSLVPVPPAGYFPLHQLVQELDGDSQENFLPQPARNNHNQAPAQQEPQQPAPDAKDPTDVVSDDEGGDNDLFPSLDADAMMLSSDPETGNAAQHASQGPVILLPPSSTAEAAVNGDNSESLYPNVQDMECGDGGEAKEDPPESEDGVTATVIPAATKRYGSGLGNMGNTCFMNSTIQCLAHTGPLRHYFLSGEYEKDLNKDNPLGTGGDLATEFAGLLAEIWGTAAPACRKVVSRIETTSTYASSSSVVYPRSFKYTLGKHAEQFMGYDQHDSQELATYLLDALHEDTNRVTKKPYVEKPEKGEDEPDEVAARKAWDLHLKREDSRVLENFMGQIKSRVQCCKEGCGRVSTTFDPFMYLSVPIPGSTERTLKVTFVPLDGQQKKKELTVTLGKASAMNKLVTKVAEQLMKAGLSSNGRPFSLDELCVCDVWNHEVYSWYGMDDDIDKIRENDETYIFQVARKEDIQKMEESGTSTEALSEEATIAEALENAPYRPSRYKVDAANSMQMNRNEEWKTILEDYTRMPRMQLVKVLNPRRGTTAERFDLYQKLDSFVVSCIRESDKASNKRAREEEDDEEANSPNPQEQAITSDSDFIIVSPDEEDVPALLERSEASQYFTKVKTRFDLAVLESCAARIKRMIVDSLGSDKKKSKDGYHIAVYSRRTSTTGTNGFAQDKSFVNPVVLRVPSTMTVYGLREELAQRLGRSLRTSRPGHPGDGSSNHESPESGVVPMEGEGDDDDDNISGLDSMNVSDAQSTFGDPALLIMRQIPLTYRKKTMSSYGQKTCRALGALETEPSSDGTRPISLASPTDEDEQQLVSEWVGDKGTIYLEWSAELCHQYFDETEFEASEEVTDPDEEEAIAAQNRKANRPITILDCVEKYCQKEQLEETEMWYCNRCKDHVRAWKQFSLYVAPPFLIVHLKRFQYSASSHRRDKISTFIDFPLTGLDLSDQVMHFADGEKPIYDCYAVSNHYGGLGGGHYTAYALNDDGIWCHYDDSRITDRVDPKEVVSEAAYVVYYRRRDVEVNNNFLQGYETPAIVADHVDRARSPPRSEASSTNAAHGDDDMDVDLNTGDGGSNASSRTCSSPMDSHDGDNGDIRLQPGQEIIVPGGYTEGSTEPDLYGPSQ